MVRRIGPGAPDGARGSRAKAAWAGAAVASLLALLDLAVGHNFVLIPALVVGSLIAVAFAGPGQTALVVVYTVALAVALGAPDDIWGTGTHASAVAAVAAAGVLAVWLAARRQAHDRELEALAPTLERQARLVRALHVGRMGEWSWDRASGRVEWDGEAAALFGLPRKPVSVTFDGWLARVDERDREVAANAVAEAVAAKRAYRFDHRARWADGAVHWIEGIGELVLDEHGEVTGGFGLVVDIDDRIGAAEERVRLLAVERAARERNDYLARVDQVLGRSLDVDEIVEEVTRAAVPELADWCSVVVTADRPPDEPLVAVAHADPEMVLWAKRLQARHPYDPDAEAGIPAVIRTGVTDFTPEIDAGLIDHFVADVELREIVKNLDLRSSIIVALPGPLGRLGALQLVRSGEGDPFTRVDVELAEDLADRIGAALNNALLFERQRRGRTALDSLQRVTSRLSVAPTGQDIVNVVVDLGRAGVSADAGVIYLIGEDGRLHLAAHAGYAPGVLDGWETIDLAQPGPVPDCVRESRPILLPDRQAIEALYPGMMTNPNDAAMIAAPLELRGQHKGALLFSFERRHSFTPEDIAMVTTLAGRCAGATERARLYERQSAISLTLQRRLLPELPPMPAWLAAAARYRPASGGEVGGDWYQLFDLGNGQYAAAVGDAVGRGIPAAAAMGQLRAALAAAAGTDPDPARVIAAVDTFAGTGEDTVASSLIYLVMSPDGGVRFALAGHPPGLLVSAGSATRLLDDGRGPVLGVVPGPRAVNVATAHLGLGDSLVLYTDGLIERRDEPIDDGIERLARAAAVRATLGPDEMCDELLATMLGGREVGDDVAILVLRRTGATEAPPGTTAPAPR